MRLTCLFVHKHRALIPIQMIAPPLCDLMVEKPPTKNKTTYTLNPATALWQRSWAYTLWFKKKERKKKETQLSSFSSVCTNRAEKP